MYENIDNGCLLIQLINTFSRTRILAHRCSPLEYSTDNGSIEDLFFRQWFIAGQLFNCLPISGINPYIH